MCGFIGEASRKQLEGLGEARSPGEIFGASESEVSMTQVAGHSVGTALQSQGTGRAGAGDDGDLPSKVRGGAKPWPAGRCGYNADSFARLSAHRTPDLALRHLRTVTDLLISNG